MPPDLNERALAVYRAARGLPQDHQAEYISRACGADRQLHARVQSLLLNDHTPTATREPGAREQDSHVDETSAWNPTAHRVDRLESTEDAQDTVGSRYRINAAAGVGGMGRVYHATDTVLDRPVAIKIQHQSIGSSDAHERSQRSHLLIEARAMAKLNHPNLCRVLEVSLESQVPFIVMDWVDGIDFRRASCSLNLDQRMELFVKVVEAVGALHAVGLMHRDIKPVNILVDRRGEPVIVDFGLAKFEDSSGTTSHTLAGTPGYSAPEQFSRTISISPSSDVYSLGVLLFELLTDRLPFADAPQGDLMRWMQEHDPPIPETYSPGLPWPLQRICLAAMERDPARRYPNAHAMALDLQRYLRGESVAARPSTISQQFGEQIERQISQTDIWRRQGLITEREANRMGQLLNQFLRPESHWILDSRRLTISQVTLYLGGWMILLALGVGLMMSWTALTGAPALRYAAAGGVAVLMLASGIVLHRRGDFRVSLGYFVTACLACTIATWLYLRETNLLGPIETTPIVDDTGAVVDFHTQVAGMAGAEWSEVILGEDPLRGLCNRQVLVIAVVWLILSLWLRRFSSSSAFTPMAVLAGGSTWFALWASAGLLDDDRRAWALLGVWLLAMGAGLLWPGLWLNRREELHDVKFGRARVRHRDSWAVLSGAVALMLIGMSLTAWNVPDVYTLGFWDEPTRSARATAFLINGIALQGLCYLLERKRTIVRTRVAEVLRWITPQHFLGAMLAMELDEDNAIRDVWLVGLWVGAIVFCYWSVIKQWRPFLITGLAYLGAAYFETFHRIAAAYDTDLDTLFDDSATIPSSLNVIRIVCALGLLVMGAVTMTLAWKLPGWLQRRSSR